MICLWESSLSDVPNVFWLAYCDGLRAYTTSFLTQLTHEAHAPRFDNSRAYYHVDWDSTPFQDVKRICCLRDWNNEKCIRYIPIHAIRSGRIFVLFHHMILRRRLMILIIWIWLSNRARNPRMRNARMHIPILIPMISIVKWVNCISDHYILCENNLTSMKWMKQ